MRLKTITTASCIAVRANRRQASCIAAMQRHLSLRDLLLALAVVLLISGQNSRVSGALNSVLDIERDYPYLLKASNNGTSKQIINPSDYMDFDNIYSPNETYKKTTSASTRNYHLLKAFDFANYFQSDYWHYSSEDDLRKSAWPVSNETLCGLQLDWLESQLVSKTAGQQPVSQLGEQHVQLARLKDSFGRPQAGTLLGNNLWLGSYYECLRVAIDTREYLQEACDSDSPTPTTTMTMVDHACAKQNAPVQSASPSDQSFKTRYCLAKVRPLDWPSTWKDNYRPVISYKMAVCLPEACESVTVQQRKQQLASIMGLQSKQQWPDMDLYDMYCLPDSRSPLRELSLSGKLLLCLCLVWLSTVVIGSLGYQRWLSRQLAVQTSRLGCDTTVGEPINSQQSKGPKMALKQQLAVAQASWPEWLVKVLEALSIRESFLELPRPPAALARLTESELRVNLNALDAIKCLCCILVVMGHVAFIHMQHMRNIELTIELSYMRHPRLLIAFFNFVDTFFMISGMLTAYFLLKRFNKHTFGDPRLWLQISLLRFLRLTPVYILVFWFAKTLSAHLSDGPIWDYATDERSPKGLCSRDNWWKSILYLGNWNTMQPLCILPAWSIIVDSQYSLVLPPLVYLLMRHKRLCYVAIAIAATGSTVHMSYQLANQTSVKASDMAGIRLHVYPLISRFAAEFYNTAWNRIGPVAIGLLGGRLLYLYDTRTIKRWPWYMRGVCFQLVLAGHLLILMMPAMATPGPPVAAAGSVDLSSGDMALFVASNAAIKPIWSIINTILLLRLVTDLRSESAIARLMGHNFWHSMGKLCFTAYLIHYEIIMLLLGSRADGLVEPTWTNLGREFSATLLITLIISYVTYILYESPINRLVTVLFDTRKHRPRDCLNSNNNNTAATNDNGCVANHQLGQALEQR